MFVGVSFKVGTKVRLVDSCLGGRRVVGCRLCETSETFTVIVKAASVEEVKRLFADNDCQRISYFTEKPQKDWEFRVIVKVSASDRVRIRRLGERRGDPDKKKQAVPQMKKAVGEAAVEQLSKAGFACKKKRVGVIDTKVHTQGHFELFVTLEDGSPKTAAHACNPASMVFDASPLQVKFDNRTEFTFCAYAAPVEVKWMRHDPYPCRLVPALPPTPTQMPKSCAF